MHVLISAMSRFVSPTGICRHAANLAFALEARREIRRISFVTGSWQEQYYREILKLGRRGKINVVSVPIRNNSLARNLWFMHGLPRMSRAMSADVIHLSFPVPFDRRSLSSKTVATLHDLYPYDVPESCGFPRAFLMRRVLRKAIANADAIACVSQTTLSRLRELFPRAAQKSVKIFNVVRRWEVTPRMPAGVPFRDFALMVAQHRRNKNLLLALEGFAQLRQQKVITPNAGLVIVGSAGPETPAIKRTIATLQLEGAVLTISAISDAELCWLYKHCLLFLVTSTTEGFCLPLVEAMLAGCRIVCSDIPVLREIGSVQCAYFDLKGFPLGNLLYAARKICSHAAPHQTRASEFTPEAIGEQYSDLYFKLVEAQIHSNAGQGIAIASA